VVLAFSSHACAASNKPKEIEEKETEAGKIINQATSSPHQIIHVSPHGISSCHVVWHVSRPRHVNMLSAMSAINSSNLPRQLQQIPASSQHSS
jgi:hypothetical protein